MAADDKSVGPTSNRMTIMPINLFALNKLIVHIDRETKRAYKPNAYSIPISDITNANR